jgi:hypothetical protein
MGDKEKLLIIMYYLIAIFFIWLLTDPDIWKVIINSLSKPIQ